MRYDNAGAGMDMSPRRPRLPAAFAVCLTAACLCCLSSPAWAQSTFYYGGGSRTWSNAQSWWQSYLATAQTQAGTAPGVADTAIFNTSGSNASGTAVFTGDASVRGLRVLQTATGGLTLRSADTTVRLLTLGSGGIRVQPGNTSALTLGGTSNPLNVTLGASQAWQLSNGVLTISNTVAGSAASGTSQTLLIDKVRSVSAANATFTDGPNGKLNVWINLGAAHTVAPGINLSSNNTLTGTLTLQQTGSFADFNYSNLGSGTYATISQLQLAGGALASGSFAFNPAGTINMLGGASMFGSNQGLSTVATAGTLTRSRGGGIVMNKGIVTGASATLVSGVLPWMTDYLNGQLMTISSGSIALATGPTVTFDALPLASANNDSLYGVSNSGTLTASRQVGAATMSNSAFSWELNGYSFTTNVLNLQRNSNGTQLTSLTVTSNQPSGFLGIGSSGELAIVQNTPQPVTIAASIRESASGGWVTLGAQQGWTGGPANATFTLSGSNSHSGGTSILSRRLNINNAYALGSGTFRIGGNLIVLDNTTAGPLTIATNNVHEWNSDFAFQGTQDLNLGTGTVSLGTWAGTVRTVTVNAGSLTVGGRIVDGSYSDLPTTGLAKDGPGALILSGSNGYTGVTESWGGELRFANRSALYGSDTSKWTAANITTGSGAIVSVSVGDQAGAFTSADLDILDGAVGGLNGGYLGIDTTGATSGTYTYGTNITAPGGDRVLGIAKTGVGTLVLTGSNTFTGGVLAREGRLLVTNANQVGQGMLVAAGGLLDMSGLTVSNTFSIASGTIANTAVDAAKFTAAVTGPAVFSGTLTGAGANGNWTKSGTGTLVLSTANTFTGTTTLTGGLLSISSDANLNGTASALVFNGGGLQVTGTDLTSLAGRPTTFTSGQTVTFDIADPANTFAVAQNLQHGNAGLTKSGLGTLVASGNNTFTGNVTVAGGTLRMGSATGLVASSTGAITTSGGVLDLNGNSLTRGTVTIAGGLVTGGTLTSTATYAAQSGTAAAGLAGTVGLTKTTAGVFLLSGTNTYSGLTTVSAGMLVASSTTALPGWNTGNYTIAAGGVLALGSGYSDTDAGTVFGTGTFAANASVGFDTSAADRNYGLVIANARGLTKVGSGTLTLSASNTFTGTTAVGYAGGPNSGVLQLASTGFVSPTVTIFGGTFDTAGQNRSITTLTLGAGGAGSTASLQTGSGTATLAGNVTFTATNNPAGATIGGNLSLGGAARTFTVNDSTAADADLTISAVINQGGVTAFGLTKSGVGTLALTGQNTFAGKVSVNQGTVQIDSINSSGASPLGTNTTTDLGSDMQPGTLRWVGATSGTTSRTFNLAGTTGGGTIEASGVGALVITGTVTATGAGAKTLTLGGTGTAANTVGTILNGSGTTAVVKDGPGLWRVNAASGYTGSFAVKNGTLVAAVDSVGTTGAFGAGSVTDVFVGDSSPTASGTASLLLAAGFNTNKVMNVLGGGGSQAVILGGEGGRVDFQGDLYLGRAVTLVAGPSGTTFFSGAWKGLSGTGALGANVAFGSPGNTGVVSVSRGLATSGSVGVRFGTLNLGTTGTVAAGAPLGIDAGATLAGIGFVTGTLGGAGLVAPGNSPGILTAGAVDPSGGLDWAFEFTNATPDYTSSSNSLNDILRLTGTAPFTTSLTPANEIAVYLDVASLADGNTFRGGFFTDQPGAFTSSIAAATYTYWVSGSGAGQTTYQTKTYVPLASLYPSLSMGVTTVSDTATFSGGSPTSGQVMQFTVVVPEPGAIALAALGLGLAGYALRRRRFL